MTQEIKIVARTFEIDKVAEISGYSIEDLEINTNHDLTLLAGKAAGVCYMPDDYFENGVQDIDKAYARAISTSKNGHHSVFDHGHITMVIKTSKMMAMILNSLGVYATSEKSARYTKMQPETDLELQLYNKWKEKIQKLILDKYPNTDDALLNTRLCKKLGIEKTKIIKDGKIAVNLDNFKFMSNSEELISVYEVLTELKKSETLPSYKLAMENARYMISVFTPTTMMYTVSFRQLHLISSYLQKLEETLTNNKELVSDNFYVTLLDHVVAFRDEIINTIGDERIKENKNQHIRFLEYPHAITLVDEELSIEDKKWEAFNYGKREVIGDAYTLVYTGSFAMLAQAQRHRTTRCTMYLDTVGQFDYYVPPIVEDAGLRNEWLYDISSVAYCTPQGTLVKITEQGIFEDFILKCKERLCGRAQLEIANSTKLNLEKFISNKDNLCELNKLMLQDVTSCDHKVLPRCLFTDFTCTEGCQWGAKAFERLI